MPRLFATLCFLAASTAWPAFAQDRETKVRTDRQAVEEDGYWIYNDLPKAVAEAKRQGKPLLVTLRCIPCENCAQLDEKVVERDPLVRTLLDQFVCVRVVQANGLDLSLFQFDFDQSWAAFFLNPSDMTIYGRYGTRSHQRESHDDISIEGFAAAMKGALALHDEYPKNKAALAAKRGKPMEYPVPEEYPSLKGRFTSQLNYQGNVVQSCMHCHQVGEALRLVHRTANEPIPDEVLFPYPNPKALGLVLDPKEKAKVKSVTPDSRAAADGFRPGDELVTLEGQPLLSIADVQWVLHNAPAKGKLAAEVRRGERTLPLAITLNEGWRKQDDIGWRATSWDLRRMLFGGMKLDEATPAQRRQAGVADDALALQVMHVGQFGPHAIAKNAGVQRGDILVSMNGSTDRRTEGELLAWLAQTTKPKDRIPVTVFRGGRRMNFTIALQ
ncbi:MAG: Trx7/PDZ domain-containing (seleno)protein [Planctomycetaceae bacterium]